MVLFSVCSRLRILIRSSVAGGVLILVVLPIGGVVLLGLLFLF